MFISRRAYEALLHRIQDLVDQRDQARADAAAHLNAAKRTAGRSLHLETRLAAETARANRLQARLDDATSLNSPAVDAGALWQSRRGDKPKPTAPKGI